MYSPPGVTSKSQYFSNGDGGRYAGHRRAVEQALIEMGHSPDTAATAAKQISERGAAFAEQHRRPWWD
jgi:hypothetical protein